MDRGANAVRQQLGVAREQKDVVKTLCLNDKLNQIDLAIRTATDRVDGLGAAVAQTTWIDLGTNSLSCRCSAIA